MTETRWAWVEIDLASIRHNVRALSALTPPGTGFMAVVKADAYGHGAVPVARRRSRGRSARTWGLRPWPRRSSYVTPGISAPVHLLSEPPATAATVLLELRPRSDAVHEEFARRSERGCHGERHCRALPP